MICSLNTPITIFWRKAVWRWSFLDRSIWCSISSTIKTFKS